MLRGHQVFHGPGKVGVQHHLVIFSLFAVGQFHAPGLPVFHLNRFHRCFQKKVGPLFLSEPGQLDGNLAEAALNVINAKGVLNISQHGKSAGTFPGGHAQILGLEGKGKSQIFPTIVALEHLVNRLMQGQTGHGLQ